MKEEILNQLLLNRHGPCLSILLPLHKTGSNRILNKQILDRAVRKAKAALKKETSDPSRMLQRLEGLRDRLNPHKPPQSIGLFVSPVIAEFVCFPFIVAENIVLDDTFQTRDLYYLKQFMAPYYTLLITSKFVRLCFSQGSQLDEIHDGIFPMEYKEQYEYQRSAVGSSYGYGHKAYEGDKSSMTKLRIESFYRESITNLQPYLRNKDIPLVVVGTKESIASFAKLNDINDSIAAKVYGIFKEENLEPVAEKAWMSLREFRKKKEKETIQQLQEKDLPGKLAKGVQEVWQAAIAGRGKRLLIEKDYSCTSYLKDGDPTLYLTTPKGKYTIVPDVVDEIIETVIEKGGTICYTDNRALRTFDSVVLELRY